MLAISGTDKKKKKAAVEPHYYDFAVEVCAYLKMTKKWR